LNLLKLVKYCTIPNKRLFLSSMSKSKVLLLLIVTVCFYAACKTDPAYNTATQLKIDDDSIAKFIVNNNILNTSKTASGLYYQIISPGTGSYVYDKVTDSVYIHYVARLLTGVLYDSTSTNLVPTGLVLGNVIQGWQEGIPLVQPGGHIRLLVPSPLAYQNRIIGILPKNTILDFDIQIDSAKHKEQFFVPKASQ